jgi:hypothetical protein
MQASFRVRPEALLVLSLAAVLFSGCRPEPSAVRHEDLRAFLPSAGEAGEWRAEGTPLEYTGEDLYLYIDGGAEIYREYGFETVLVQDYGNAEGGRLSLEIFRMSSPESAFGMYTFKRGAKGRRVEVGSGGRLEDYYLNFWKGPFVVTITGPPESGDGSGLLRLGHAVAGRIRGRANPPALMAALPREGLVENSRRYFRGSLGFMNLYPSLGREAFTVEEGVRGDYSSGAILMVLRYSGEDGARRCFAAVRDAIRADPRSSGFALQGEASFRLIDDRGRRLTVRTAGRTLLVGIEDAASGDVPALFEAALANL